MTSLRAWQITKTRKAALIGAVLPVLKAYPEGLAASDVLKAVAQAMPPTGLRAGHLFRGSRRFEKIVRFCTITPSSRLDGQDQGCSTITDEGRAAVESHTTPESLWDLAWKLYQAWKKAQPADGDDEDVSDPDDATSPTTTLEEAEEAAWAEIRSYLANMPPYEFQELVGDLLRAMGYYVDWIAPPGADGGVDVIAYADPLGTAGPRVKVQVKRRSSKSSPDDIRAFLAVLGEQDSGLFVSTGGFTSEAQREARAQEKRRLVLVDDTRLVELWIEHYSSLDDTARQRLPLRPIHFLAPAD
ncbi:MAG: restriction endonuclease [Gaiellales bacterium]